MLAAGKHRAASLVQSSWFQYFDAGLGTTVRRWLRALEASAAKDNTATVVTAAWMAALSGEKEELDQRLAQLNNASDDVALPDGTRSVESVIALIRGLFGFGGPTEMLASAAASRRTRDGWQHGMVCGCPHGARPRQLCRWRSGFSGRGASQGRVQRVGACPHAHHGACGAVTDPS